MYKKIFIGILTISMLVVGGIGLLRLNNNSSAPFSVRPTPLVNTIGVVSYVPPNGSIDVSVHEIITATVSEPLTRIDIDVTNQQDTEVSISVEGNTVFIAPKTQWSYGTSYQFELVDTVTNTPLGSYRFTTVGEVQQEISGKLTKGELLQQNPAQYLAEQTPFGEPTFSVVSDYDTEQNSFIFLVETAFGVPRSTGISNFRTWVVSQGLTSQQLDGLSVEYFEAER
ncbi:Ig-like domain-containing protein [Candidatus Roizmanbacteria bacterium]|nr:Ig-like domain-containing protein [Candidatus Roizmanbacteria bacterium]